MKEFIEIEEAKRLMKEIWNTKRVKQKARGLSEFCNCWNKKVLSEAKLFEAQNKSTLTQAN